MTDPDSWRHDPDAPRMLLDMIESAKAVRPTITEKAELGARLGISTGGVLTLPLAKWLAGSVLVVGGGLALLTGLPEERTTTLAPPSAAHVSQPEAQPSDSVPGQPVASTPTATPGFADPNPAEATEPQLTQPMAKQLPKSKLEGPSKREAQLPGTQLAPGKSSEPTEAQLLTAARGLVARDPKGALRLLAQHETLYPQGVLGQEREVLRVRALKQAGQVSSAEREAEEFRKAHPESAHTTNL